MTSSSSEEQDRVAQAGPESKRPPGDPEGPGQIPGIGIDLVPVRRLERLISRWGARFCDRVFTPDEIAFCESRRNRFESYAARFAAKEALSKAIGIGIGPGMRWRDVETVVRPSGRPDLVCRGAAGSLVAGRTILLSLSHTEEYAAAAVLIL
jgi:holo-[acyl-carrier protein] synthase